MVFRRNKKKKHLTHKNRLITQTLPKSPISEQYRVIRTNIQYTTVDKEVQLLMVTSSDPGEGKTTTAANLAIVFAQQGKKVLLVDADLRKPNIHYLFNLPNAYGLTSILVKSLNISNVITSTEEERLFILTSGPIPPNPAELLSSIIMKDLIEELKQEFDLIIFDTPPLLAVTDAQIVANICDSSILVIASSKTEKEKALKSKELLSSS